MLIVVCEDIIVIDACGLKEESKISVIAIIKYIILTKIYFLIFEKIGNIYISMDLVNYITNNLDNKKVVAAIHIDLKKKIDLVGHI